MYEKPGHEYERCKNWEEGAKSLAKEPKQLAE